MSDREQVTPWDAATSAAYGDQRRQLIAAGLPTAAWVIFTLTLTYNLIDWAVWPAHFRAEWLPNLGQQAIPLIGLWLATGPLRHRIEPLTLAIDIVYSAALASPLLLPTASPSSAGLFLSVKMLATSILFPRDARLQYWSAAVTLGIYWALLAMHSALPTTPPFELHEILGPTVAALLSALGATRAERIRRDLFLRGRKLDASQRELGVLLDAEHALVEIAREISVVTELPIVLERLNRLTAGALRCDFSNTFLLDPDGRSVSTISTHSVAADLRQQVLSTRFPTDSPLAQEVLHHRPVIINDPASQPWVDPSLLTALRVYSLMLVPIVSKDRVLGALSAGHGDATVRFSDRDLGFLQGIATHAAIAIENARLFDDLRASETRYRDLFEHANDLIGVIDEHGSVRFANQAALTFLGGAASDLGRITLQQLLPAASLAQITRRLAIARRRRLDATRAFTVDVRRPDGTTAILDVRSSLISAPDQPRVYQCIARDMTQRHRQELQTQEWLRRVQEANRLQAEFVANTSHELRTPLNVILGYLEVLLDLPSIEAEADVRTILERIGASARALHRLVESVLEYARLDRGGMTLSPTRFSADQLLSELRALGGDIAGGGVQITVGAAPDILLRTDYGRLYSVLSNLLLNAIKFTTEGTVELLVDEQGGRLAFRVRDTGIGIPPDHLEHIFEPFRQVDGSTTRSFGGVGLGLAIVRRNVDLLGGEVSVQSHVGVGTTFIVSIPTDVVGKTEDANPVAPRIAPHHRVVGDPPVAP